MKRLFALTLLILAGLGQAQEHPLLSAGPMLAYSEMTEVAIWVQTKKPARVKIRYWLDNPQVRVRPFETKEFATTDIGDHLVTITIPRLMMGQKYNYALLINGQEVPRDYTTQFQTQPHWRWAKNPAEPPEFTVAIGSCAYINEDPFDRPGKPYGSNEQIFTAIHQARPDFMVWMGDNIYFREMDWLTEAAMRHRWRHSRSLPVLQPLLASTHHYATWDDHDFGPNDSDKSFRLRDTALKLFAQYFPAVTRGLKEAPGNFQRFEWGDTEFFLLDDRYYRSPDRMPAGSEKTMLGRAQVQWLKECLVSSGATFKIVVNGSQMLNNNPFESFGDYAHERKDLFDFLAVQKIPGLVFLSGDRHASELLKTSWPGALYPWYEFTCSPLTASPASSSMSEPLRVEGTYVGRHNFGLIKAVGRKGERRLILSCHEVDGKEIWRREIAEAELRGS